jgi:NADPH:quinone reductase
MQALEIHSYGEPLRLVEKPIPEPVAGEVLIKIAASPINPSDLMFLRGLYGLKKPLPIVPGFEASGVVVKAGKGILPRLWLGKRVACVAPDQGDGTWAEYMVTTAKRCVPLLKSVSLEQGSMLVVNPWTAWALLDTAKKEGHSTIAHTAAASALGRMLLKLCQREGISVVNIVRSPTQVELLTRMGAKYVLDSSDSNFKEQMCDAFRKLKVTLAFDAVGGELTGNLLSALHHGGRVVVYGGLSEQNCMASPYDLIFQGKKIEGFWVSDWLLGRNFFQQCRMAFTMQRLLSSELQSEIRQRVALKDVPSAIKSYTQEMTKGKMLITPGG